MALSVFALYSDRRSTFCCGTTNGINSSRKYQTYYHHFKMHNSCLIHE